MTKHILKSYYGDIFFEFLLQDSKADAVFFLPGFPSSNNHNQLMMYLYEQGFHVFTIRYRGSYQSKGVFLEKDPVSDMLEFIDEVKKGKAVSLWDQSELSFEIDKNILCASSFGGAVAAGTLAKNDFFDKAIFFAPVWDFQEHNTKYPEQDLLHLTGFTRRAFQNCYRIDCDNIAHKIREYPSMSKEVYLASIDKPILVFHGTKDHTVRIEHTHDVCERNANIQLVEHMHGHGKKTELLHQYQSKLDSFLRE